MALGSHSGKKEFTIELVPPSMWPRVAVGGARRLIRRLNSFRNEVDVVGVAVLTFEVLHHDVSDISPEIISREGTEYGSGLDL